MILQGNCLDVLKTLAPESVQCVVTSPPYFCLRDYGVVGQIGLERTPEAYIAALVEVFQAVHVALHSSGTLWLNIGDSYAASGRGGGGGSFQNNAMGREISEVNGFRMPPPGYKQKDLIGIPWMLAFALRSSGWYLRAEIIWNKLNPMPESVTDRPTKAHEQIFLMSKSRSYYYDADAIAEPLSDVSLARYERVERNHEVYDPARHKNGDSLMHNAPMEVLTRAAARVVEKGTRNKRSVWTVPTQPYAGAHFATFPEALIEPCILAGSRQGDVVLDPFAGAGTVGVVCQKAQRRFVGIELNGEYVKMAEARIAAVAPLFASEIGA